MIDESIEELERDILQVQDKMKDFKIQRDITYNYFLGITGSGKSTSINYLMNGILEYTKSKGKFQIKSPATQGCPLIGHSNESCTVIPALYRDPNINTQIYVDPPGFLDTKGPIQQTINSYSNARMFQRGTQTKIIIVMEYATLQSGRGNNVSEVAKRLFSLFPRDFDRLTASIMILITKVPLNDIEEEEVYDLVHDITKQNNNMNIECKAMLSSIFENRRIFILPVPTQINIQHLNKLKEGILNVKQTMISANASISLSYEAKSKLQDLSSILTNEINSNSKNIRGQMEIKFQNRSLKSKEEYEEVISKLKNALNIVLNEGSAGFQESFQSFAQLIDLNESVTKKVIENFNKMDFCKALHSEIRPNLNLIDSIINCLRQSIGILDSQLSKLITKEEIEAMNQRHQAQIEQRNRQFKEHSQQLARDAERREQEARQQLASQRQHFANMLQKSQQSHQQSIKVLQKQIQDLANRPPQVIHHTKRVCVIM